ncbi:signal recognition particle 19 kDa protein isoform X2 [Denticeps clupeoides]|uniref:signal recognition particle 19 kDa protein isoform X2 n=1 Tax=Denticeps clupeoides TaxID=299321 RepID=UPI0010A4F52A|nr:signal recognition particle 19 kDa protein isoform X2 [Denticeps clupeoides]
MAHLTESPSDKERFMCIYPAYINSKRTLAEGRRIASEKAVENPTCAEIRDVLTAAGMNVHVENKMYPREWNRDVQFRGRVRVQVKKEDGSLYLDKFSSQGKMKIDRRVDIPVYDLSLIRGLWETRVKKYKQRQKKEKERLSQSALTKVNQQWQYRIACRKMKSSEMVELQHYLERSSLREVDIEPYLDTGSGADAGLEVEEKRFIFELCGDEWTEVPPALYEMTYLREWHIRSTKILKIPEFIEMFQDLRVLDMPKNCIEKLPVEIGKLVNLRELNVSYNRLCEIPPELGDCENLEVMELTSNLNLNELPFEESEEARPSGHCGEQVCQHSRLRPAHERPAVAGPEQQPAHGPA